MDARRKEILRGWGLTYDTVYGDGKFEDLKTILLNQGGEAVIILYNVDKWLDKLVLEGKFFGQNYTTQKNLVGFALHDDECWRFQFSEDLTNVTDYYGIPQF